MNIQKKIKSIGILLFLFLISSFAIAFLTNTVDPVLVDGQMGIAPETADAVAQEVFTITIKAKLGVGQQATGAETKIIYDSNQLELNGDNPVRSLLPVNWGTDFLAIDTSTSGEIFFSHSFLFGGIPVTGNFDVATISFKIKQNAASPIIISLNQVNLISGADNLATETPSSSTITISAPPAECAVDNDCDDAKECTTDTCVNPGAADASCSYAFVADNTLCMGGICCLGVCDAAPGCSTNSDCEDNKPCTTDTCNNAGTCEASCSNTAIIPCCGNNQCELGEPVTCSADCPAECTPDGCNGVCPLGCSLAEDPDCGCLAGNTCCGIGCNNANDNDCPGVCTPDGCNGFCPLGCSDGEDPDCGCVPYNDCCGVGCGYNTDVDCRLIFLETEITNAITTYELSNKTISDKLTAISAIAAALRTYFSP